MIPTDEEIDAKATELLGFNSSTERYKGWIAGAKWMLEQMFEWISVEERLPLAFQTGDWDGKKSDKVLVRTKDDRCYVAEMYQGIMDGNEFSDFYDDRDFEIKDVRYWKEI